MSDVRVASTWLRFSTSSAAVSEGASTLRCRTRLVSITPNGVRSDLLSRADGLVEQGLRRDHATDQADGGGLARVDETPGEQDLRSPAHPDDARQEVGGAAVTARQADTDERCVETGCRRGDPDVGGKRQ